MDDCAVLCVLCSEGEKEGDLLNQVGRYWNPEKGTEHPLNTLITQATKCELSELSSKLTNYKENNTRTYVHNSCRTKLKNRARGSRRKSSTEEQPSSSKRVCGGIFDFKTQCFYCEKICKLDRKHPDRNKFIEVRTISSNLHKETLDICKTRSDEIARALETRLLSVSDLVAAEARYHVACRTNFSNVTSENKTSGRPISSTKMELFEQACIKFLENDIELYSVSEFHNMMSTLGDDVYTIKMTQVKLKERYKETLQLVTREGKSNIILLHRASEFLSEKWYAERKKDIKDESERIVRTAALLIKEAIKNYDLDSANYPSSKDIKTSSNVIPSILTIFLHGLFSSSIKEKTLAQAIVAATRPRSIMPIQFGLAVCTDNKIGSKWLNILLSKLGLAVSYDEVVRFKQNVIKHDTSNEVVCPEGTTFLQFVSDNTDHDLATLDGKQTHHGLGSLAVANGNFGAQRLPTRRIPREKKENWSNIQGNKGIEIHEYLEPEVPALAKTVMKPITIERAKKFSFIDLLWTSSYMFKGMCPSWSGYMSSKFNGPVLQKSHISMLPIIDMHATDPTALYSLLLFVIDQCTKLKFAVPCITFDQQLYIKAYEIVASKNLSVFVRLGGFHQLMSFLGSIGKLMEGSGLNKALETVYAPVTVQHMFTGKAYSRAIRGHLLCASAVQTLLIEEFWHGLSPDEKSELEGYYKSEDPYKYDDEELAMKLKHWVDVKHKDLSKSSRTAALWSSYIKYVNIVQDFIRAERTNDWIAHIISSKAMLNLYAATGHSNYAKSCRLYLQSVLELEKNHPKVYEEFVNGNHTVRRTWKGWAGIWTDLSIEQILMKSLKGRSGVVAKGITENVLHVWTKTMHRCAEITDAMESIVSEHKISSVHKELMDGRVRRDYQDFQKIKDWFQDHNPFTISEELVALESGLVDVERRLTCDKAEEVGATIQTEMDGKLYTHCSIKRSSHISTLQCLYSNVNIGSDKITIDPLTLFLRLIVLVERKPEKEIADYFAYELSPFPMSLFKDGTMRTAHKSKLKTFLIEGVSAVVETIQAARIVDGGALLWCCDWKKGETFNAIFQRYENYLVHLGVNTVIFDGYDSSTKDVTHQKRAGSISQRIDVRGDNPCPANRTAFFGNYVNKKKFVKTLAAHLENKFKVIQCPSDADTTIVKESLLVAKESSVIIFADDTDILCLLVHHVAKDKSLKEISLTDMTRKKGQPREYLKVSDVLEKFSVTELPEILLFAHAFTGCDTTSAIHMFGKTTIFKKLEESPALMSIARTFYEEASPADIGAFTIRFFELLHSPCDSLSVIRKTKYEQMVLSNRSTIDPSLLPPSPRAAYYHGLRVYHQVQVWRYLQDVDFMPFQWGFHSQGQSIVPIMTDEEAGPSDLLQVIRCGCKGECDSNRCTCRKAGLSCTSSCKECHGSSCSNVQNDNVDDCGDNFDDDFEDRHFMDAFVN